MEILIHMEQVVKVEQALERAQMLLYSVKVVMALEWVLPAT